MDREEFDLADYRARLRDRTSDYELLLDGARVDVEITRLRGELDHALLTIGTHVCFASEKGHPGYGSS